MEERGLGDNESKAEHLVSYRGKNQAPVKTWKETEEWMEENNKGVVKSSIRYLGNMRHTEGYTRDNAEKRKNHMREGWYAFKGYWNRKKCRTYGKEQLS